MNPRGSCYACALAIIKDRYIPHVYDDIIAVNVSRGATGDETRTEYFMNSCEIQFLAQRMISKLITRARSSVDSIAVLKPVYNDQTF